MRQLSQQAMVNRRHHECAHKTDLRARGRMTSGDDESLGGTDSYNFGLYFMQSYTVHPQPDVSACRSETEIPS